MREWDEEDSISCRPSTYMRDREDNLLALIDIDTIKPMAGVA